MSLLILRYCNYFFTPRPWACESRCTLPFFFTNNQSFAGDNRARKLRMEPQKYLGTPTPASIACVRTCLETVCVCWACPRIVLEPCPQLARSFVDVPPSFFLSRVLWSVCFCPCYMNNPDHCNRYRHVYSMYNFNDRPLG